MLTEHSMPYPDPARTMWEYDGVCGTMTLLDGYVVHLQGEDAASFDASVQRAYQTGGQSFVDHLIQSFSEVAEAPL